LSVAQNGEQVVQRTEAVIVKGKLKNGKKIHQHFDFMTNQFFIGCNFYYTCILDQYALKEHSGISQNILL
jgi:hypothetical protein